MKRLERENSELFWGLICMLGLVFTSLDKENQVF
jgi:hypothetical protein